VGDGEDHGTAYLPFVTAYRLPLFPLPLVLLPGVPQPLHIFERRYRALLADCTRGNGKFGILYLEPGMEEEEMAPGHVGCVAGIEEQETLADGRSNVLVRGDERFVLEGMVDDPAPYRVGLVQPHEDVEEEAAALAEAAERTSELFRRAGRAAQTLANDRGSLPSLPDDPGLLSFVIAGTIELDADSRQRLLNERSPLVRLAELEGLLASAVEPLERRAAVHVRARSNGAGLEP
jgi:Lon protease-like protein